MNEAQVIAGQALIGEELEPASVDIIIEDGIIAGIEDNPRAPQIWICPALFNAHTHLGDTIAMDCGTSGDLVELVAPPDGLKHKLLATASREDLVSGIRASIEGMIGRGIAGCADFREGGRDGVTILQEAAAGLAFKTCIFGREGGELISDGLGISSVRDIPGVEEQLAKARRAGKKIAFHAGERDEEDVDGALAFDPDLIIHATHATRAQLRQCADRAIPIAICPRSNWILGVADSAGHPPVAMMMDLGCTLMLGTDNVMFVPPDMFSEMAFTSTIYKVNPGDILRASVRGSCLTGSPHFIREGARANLFTIDPVASSLRFSRDPVATIVKRALTSELANNVFTV